jgi:transposase
VEILQRQIKQLVCLLLFSPCCMKKSVRHNYKALYQQCSRQSADKDRLIALLQSQTTQLANERQTKENIIVTLEVQLAEKQAQLNRQDVQLALQQQTIFGQDEKLAQQQRIISEQQEIMTDQQKKLDQNQKDLFKLDDLRHQVRICKKMLFGIKSEKRHQPAAPFKIELGGQLSLTMEVDSWGVCQINNRRRIPEHMRVTKTTTRQKPGGRHALPEGLEEEVTIIDTPDRPANARYMGYEDQKQLACDPMRWFIKTTRRLIYLAPDEDELSFKQWIAPLPPHPIPRCKFDISVLVLMVIDKYLYHLPIWRQRQRFLQYGIDLSYSTLCNLTNRICESLEPLWHLLLKEITVSGLMHLDETTYRVLDDTKKKGKKSHIGWMWAMMNPVQRIVCFLYQPGRGRKDIRSVLQDYKGHLLTDAYAAYTKYGRQPGVIHQHCISHARRYFVYALENDRQRAEYALDQFFGPLYGIEQECEELQLNYDEITEKRQSEALPILQALKAWIEEELPKVIQRTPIYKAMFYTLQHYDALIIYTTDGMLKLDNNLLEGQIRSIALGRRNHLFAGSHRGGELAAIIYSFMATCKLQKIDPSKWLDDVLRRIPDQPKDKLIELLPQFWKPLHQSKVKSA